MISTRHQLRASVIGCFGILIFAGMRCGGTLSTPVAGPADDEADTSFTRVVNFGFGSCGLGNKGGVYCWGQIDLTGETQMSLTPVLMTAVPKTLSFSPAMNGVCGHQVGGASFWCMGDNAMGDGVMTTSYKFDAPGTQTFAALFGVDATLQAVGVSNRCAIQASGAAMCWGSNASGELGNGTTTTSWSPVAVSGGLSFSQISTGQSHACGVTTGGAAYCWGEGDDGRLGNGGTVDSSTPSAVVGIASTAAEVYAGERHSCARLVSGVVQCWGYNSNGALGDNNACGAGACTTAQTVTTLPSAVRILTAGQTTMALHSDGTLSCWGTNMAGQFGNGDTNSSNVPVTCAAGRSGLLDFHLFAATGFPTACVVLSTGKIQCWGQNNKGQTGHDSVTTTVLTPSAELAVP